MTTFLPRLIALPAAATLAATVMAATPAAGAGTAPDTDTASSAYMVRSFQTPSGNIGCTGVKSGRKWSLRCDTREHDWAPPQLDCTDFGDNAGSVSMTRRGSARFICVSDAAGGSRVLGYGRTWDLGPFSCTSRRKGLRCYNAGGHGWFLSRERYRLF